MPTTLENGKMYEKSYILVGLATKTLHKGSANLYNIPWNEWFGRIAV